MTVNKHGVKFPCGFEVVALFGDARAGQSFLVRSAKQELEVRVTPSGRLRFGTLRPAGLITSAGVTVFPPRVEARVSRRAFGRPRRSRAR